MKSLLLDQSFAAGVGNWVADEVLYQSNIHPETLSCDIDHIHAQTIRNSILKVFPITITITIAITITINTTITITITIAITLVTDLRRSE